MIFIRLRVHHLVNDVGKIGFDNGTNLFSAVFRVRSVAAMAVHTYFQDRGYLYVHTPLITGADCEGSDQMFKVTTLNMNNLPMTDDGKVDFSKDCLEKKARWWGDDDPTPPDDPKPDSDSKDKKKKPGYQMKKKKVVRFKLRPNREKMDKRKCTSEHPFGTIKRWQDVGYFLLCNMWKVNGEFALFGIGYNLSRAENMFSFNELMERVGRKTA